MQNIEITDPGKIMLFIGSECQFDQLSYDLLQACKMRPLNWEHIGMVQLHYSI